MKPSIEDYEKHEKNPFLLEAFSHFKQTFHKKQASNLLNEATGELTAVFIENPNKVYHKDQQGFVKVYAQAFATIFDLSKPAQKVVQYFIENLQQDSDLVEFNLKTVKKFCEYTSNQPIYSGLAELIEHKFIARTEVHYKYFINPTMFFNGDRKRIVKEIMKRAEFGKLEPAKEDE